MNGIDETNIDKYVIKAIKEWIVDNVTKVFATILTAIICLLLGVLVLGVVYFIIEIVICRWIGAGSWPKWSLKNLILIIPTLIASGTFLYKTIRETISQRMAYPLDIMEILVLVIILAISIYSAIKCIGGAIVIQQLNVREITI